MLMTQNAMKCGCLIYGMQQIVYKMYLKGGPSDLRTKNFTKIPTNHPYAPKAI